MGLFDKKLFKTTTRYVINGRTYGSLDEMPEEHRRLFEDRDGDGRPDWVQQAIERADGGSGSRTIQMVTSNQAATYEVDGQRYTSLEEMPPEHRALFEDRDGDGLPNFVPKMGARQPASLAGQPLQTVDAARERPDSPLHRWEDQREAAGRPDVRRELEVAGGSQVDGVFLAILFVLAVVFVAGLAWCVSAFL